MGLSIGVIEMNSYNFETDTITYKDYVVENFFKDFPQQEHIKKYVKDNLICLYVGGSHAYGIATETSDVDIRGIFKDNFDMILGHGKIEQLENTSKDMVIYSLSKIIHLIADQNPNCMEALWIDVEEILYDTDDYWYLRGQRGSLLSKLAKNKYSGYAISQLKRLKGHSKWLVKEQEGRFNEKPKIKDYITHIDNLSGEVYKLKDFKQNSSHYYFTKVKDEIYNMWFDDNNSYPLIEEGNNFIPLQESDGMRDIHYCGVIWCNKSQFQKDLEEYNNWKSWKENRNKIRHTLEEQFGYDTKHASHTFRLLNTGIEILNGEGCRVKRPDAQFLLDIRNGEYTYEWVIKEAERLDKEVLETCYKNSKLQNSVDKKIVVDIIKDLIQFK